MIDYFVTLVITVMPMVAALIAIVRERGEDPRFAGTKIIYRS